MKIAAYALMLCFLFAAVPNPSTSQEPLSDRALVEALRRGGYNIYFRHAATDWSREDHVAAKGDWASCEPEKMRQLSVEGREIAQRIGEAVRRLGIPVGRVYASEYCRTRETAQLMNLGPVTSTLAIMNMRAAEFVGGRDSVIERARRALSTPPQENTNAVYVAHGNLLRAVSGAYTGEAGAAVFYPLGNGTLNIVAELTPEVWDQLARQFGASQP